MNAITKMFVESLNAKTNHPGYSVLVRDRQGNEVEHGPYSKNIAHLCADEFKGFPFVAIEDMKTGEIFIQ